MHYGLGDRDEEKDEAAPGKGKGKGKAIDPEYRAPKEDSTDDDVTETDEELGPRQKVQGRSFEPSPQK